MSINAPQNVSFDFVALNATITEGATTSGTAVGASTSATSNTDSFAAQFTQVKAEMIDILVGSAFGSNNASSGSSGVNLTSQDSTSNPLIANLNGLSSSGYNMSLADPQSAYNMMTELNNDQVNYKAQYADLSQMGSAVQTMQQDGSSLGGISASTSNADIQSQLTQFVNQYNAWVTQFSGDMQQGGVLANTQAAQESQYELSQSVQSIFNGASDGIHGMQDIGLTIDPSSGLASLNTSTLNTELANNKQGVVDTINQFSVNFTKSASMLNQSNNFIPDQLNNLNSAISYLNSNMPSLQAEFGTGAPASPTTQVSQALAQYSQIAKS